jgi:hypothetical protein
MKKHTTRELSREVKTRVLKLLEIQRLTMAMYTSCGWFYDEISGIETIQVMRYAAKAMQRAEELFGYSLEPHFIADLKKAPSNYDADGAEAYKRLVTPSKIDLPRVGAHYAISSIFKEDPRHMLIYKYEVEADTYMRLKTGKFCLAVGCARIRSTVTWDEIRKSFAVLHLGDHNFDAGLRDFINDEAFASMRQELRHAFERGDVAETIQLMNKHFGSNNYTLWHLFRDEQRKVIANALAATHSGIESSYREIYENNSPVINFLSSLSLPVPNASRRASEYVINIDMRKIFEGEEIDLKKLDRLILESQKWPVSIDKSLIAYVAALWINTMMVRIKKEPENIAFIEHLLAVAGMIEPLELDMNLWKSQNMYFELKKSTYPEMLTQRGHGNGDGEQWLAAFTRLGDYLQLEV